VSSIVDFGERGLDTRESDSHCRACELDSRASRSDSHVCEIGLARVYAYTPRGVNQTRGSVCIHSSECETDSSHSKRGLPSGQGGPRSGRSHGIGRRSPCVPASPLDRALHWSACRPHSRSVASHSRSGGSTPCVSPALRACRQHSRACRPHSLRADSHSTSVKRHSFLGGCGCDECRLHPARGELPSNECYPHAVSVVSTHASVVSTQRVSPRCAECNRHAVYANSTPRVPRMTESRSPPKPTDAPREPLHKS
jgi:hypothetical protein